MTFFFESKYVSDLNKFHSLEPQKGCKKEKNIAYDKASELWRDCHKD